MQCLALAGMAGGVAAQQDAAKLERVEITGSSIKRVQEEGALPVQVITRKDIDRAGITSAEQLVARISANGTGADNLSSNVGIQLGTTDRNNNGNSSANLRGLGASSTLVLLNGRRVSTHGAKGNSVDLNSIPLAAVDRVEVLKDGASSLYGTDAIGGVINFILRKDYQGVELSAFADITQKGGGNIGRVSLLGGLGNLEQSGFNIMASVTIDSQKILKGSDRSFSNGNQPERGLSTDTVGTPFATQTGNADSALGTSFTLPSTGTQAYTRANLLSFQNNCNSVPGMAQYEYVLNDFAAARWGCTYDTGSTAILLQPNDRVNLVSRGTLKINPDTTAFVEAIASRSVAKKQFEPLQLTTTGSLLAARYPVGGQYYQDLSAYIPSFDPTKPIAYRWRCLDCGGRETETTTNAYRLLAGIDGVVAGKWDYKLGISTAGSKANSVLGNGYLYTDGIITALASGLVNPWLLPGQSQTPEALKLLNDARANGTNLFDGKATLLQFDGSISGELMKLPAGPLAIAAGFDVRREGYEFKNGETKTRPVFQAPFDAEFPKVSRNIKAIYTEVAVPIVKSLEATVAVRHDRYSDFGGTTNPKVSLRWNPVNEFLMRSSYNTGFRAPSFFQLYGAQGESQVPGNIADPVLCPTGQGDPTVCAIRPNALQGGNPNLGPEKSKQWSVGTVFSPAKAITASFDMWGVRRKNRIYELTPEEVVANYTTFPNNLVRGPTGKLDEAGGFIRAGFVNADGDITRGVDVGLQLRGDLGAGKWNAGLDGTYINSFRSRIFVTQPYTEFAGQWSSRDLYVRWKHQAQFTYTEGVWSGTLYQNYTSGYKDEVPAAFAADPNFQLPGFKPNVNGYTTFDVSATYTGIKNLSLTLGIKNVFNTLPPFTAHNYDFAAGAGWDPRVADPRLRSFTARATYQFQ